MLWLKLIAGALALVAVVLIVANLYGAWRWEAGTRDLRARLDGARQSVRPARFDARALEGLPAPVQRYFRAVLRDGQPMVATARMEHAGTFNVSEAGEQWKSFASTQYVVTQRPGFDWDGRIAMVPGLPVRVHDAYVAGEGILHATLLGLATLADLRGTREMAQGELMRYLAEAPWYPTALLPSQGVRWEAVDESSARATLRDGEVAVTLLFRFDAQGLIAAVSATARGRVVEGKIVPTPWEGRWWDYEVREGMRVPTAGEVAWLLPGGAKPYWRGRVTRVTYELAR
ncbi:MAG: hypothetical protein OEZ09_04120 [Betaproteobacteria bacterium]|nr:hypothetical protein [Betaproteobacteria bacterium]MDH4325852.1 hypothetical protein [Betaproteobacteria bacterium]MDH5210192.1 hypothetical protein [Betaproteobacteria bacterium]MDH5577621.1 hypothetical protein [Betaproteobacteria bacterium]